MTDAPIAIVGRACILPGASSPAALWDLARSGRDVVTDVPRDRFRIDPALVSGTPSSSVDRTYSTRGGYVTDRVAASGGCDLVDVGGAAGLAALDPLFHWVLACGRDALIDAGFDTPLRGVRAGAVLGNLSFPTEAMTLLGEQQLLDALAPRARRNLGKPWSSDVDPRNRFMSGLPAHLLARALHLDGGAFALDAACASSLYAVRLAAASLAHGRADVMLAGAVNRADSLFLHVGFCALQALSSSGTPRPFDCKADGLVPAEGCGVVALMLLDEALRQGRKIHGVIRGVGLSNDGRSKNLLAPSSEGQVRAIRAAWTSAGLSPSSADYVECHATGTPMGDRTEVMSVAEAFASSSRKTELPLGSLKGNLGHLITAAGVAGLIKVTEALAHDELPPSIHAEEPLDVLDGSLRLRVQREHAPWPRSADHPSRAGVSAFGFGGNNAHVVLEGPPSTSMSVAVPAPRAATRLAVIAAGVRLGSAHDLGGLLRERESSDAVEVDLDGVRFPPKDLETSLAQQLLAFEAARDAAHDVDALLATPEQRARAGVFIGMGTDVRITTAGLRWRAPELARQLDAAPSFVDVIRDAVTPPLGAQHILGCMPNIPANRLNVQLDIRGPGFTVSSEEHSGLAAIDVARALIDAGEIDLAFVGATESATDARHTAALAALRETGAPAAGAIVLVVVSDARARELGLDVLAFLEETASSAPVIEAATSRARLGDTHAASGLFAVAEAIARGRSVDVVVDALAAAPRRIGVRAGTRKTRDEVALLFGTAGLVSPGMGSEILAAYPAIAARLGVDEGALASVLAGTRHPPGCLADLAMATAGMQISARAVVDVLGVDAGKTIGISLGESNALFASGAWRDLGPMLTDMEQSRLFDDVLFGRYTAARAYWESIGRADLSTDPWRAVSLRARVDDVERACAASGGLCFVLVVHTDDEVEIGGAPAAVDAVLRALGTGGAAMPHMPAVHCPLLQPAAAAYRAMHRRKTTAVEVRAYSHGASELALDDDAVADAVLAQASGTVHFPRLLRRAIAEGVRVVIDVSPRGLAGSWATRIGGVEVVTVDGTLASLEAAAVQLKAAGVTARSPRPRRTMRVDTASKSRPILRGPERMTAPPRLPRIASGVQGTSERKPHPPPLPAPRERGVEGPLAPTLADAPVDEATPLARAPVDEGARLTHAPVDEAAPLDEAAAVLLENRARALDAHRALLDAMAAGQRAFLSHREALVTRAIAMTEQAEIGDERAIIAREIGGEHADIAHDTGHERASFGHDGARASLWDRRDLEVLAGGRIADVWGEMFAVQDGFRRQVRMPMAPLLLADRVISIDATAGVLETNRSIVTETDLHPDLWYLRDNRCPAGILIETGQADLLLVSYMGVDFENRGERVYRLLGCDLTYKAPLPLGGTVLQHDIHVDGFAQHGDVRIFFFHSDTDVLDDNGRTRALEVREGQVGFFTDAELADSGGILWKPSDTKRAVVDALPLDVAPCPTSKRALSHDELIAFSDGRAHACFGAGFERALSHVRSPRIPEGNLLLVDRVTHLNIHGRDVDAGPWQRGYLRAELDLSPDLWFFQGHFKDDPCMPGTVMFEGCLEVLALYLGACGFTLDKDGHRFEPALDKVFKLRCRGQATPSSRSMVYEVFVKSVSGGHEPAVVADVLVTVDGLKALHCESVELKLAVDWPLSAAPKFNGVDAVAPGTTHALLATAIGRPSDAFPGLYERFDRGRRAPRLPGPPYHFMTRVVDVSGPAAGSLARNESAAGTCAVVEYDVPPDAWYFDQGAQSSMPFAVLLEVALQPCGWVSSVVGSALTSESQLYYRNLDGQSRLHKSVPRDVGTLVTRATLTKSSASGGMIIQGHDVVVTTLDGALVFTCSTVFGFFPADALARQVGAGSTEAERARMVERCAGFDVVDLTGAAALPGALALPREMLRMIDRVTGYWPNASSTGRARVRTEKSIDPEEWFFQAHFFQDPVQPGSLGVEAMVQALMWLAIHEQHHAGMTQPRFESLAENSELVWKYRGQVVPKNALVQVELDLVDVVDEARAVLLVADASLWVDGTRIYTAQGLALRIVDDAR